MNTKLIDYGIQNENSHYRIHVCPAVSSLYVFPTKKVATLIESCNFKKVNAKTNDIITGVGYLFPVTKIPEIQYFYLAKEYFQDIKESMSTSEKGDICVQIAKKILKKNLIKLPFQISEITEKDMQIQGTDIQIKAKLNIQVKCDFKGGAIEKGGTGNLFIQIQECNPFKSY